VEGTREIGREFLVAGLRGRGQRPDHEHSRARERRDVLPGLMTKSALHAVADRCIPDRLAHHEADPRWSLGLRVGSDQVDHKGPRTGPTAATDGGPEGLGVAEPMGRGQHGVRPACRRLASDGQALAPLAATLGQDGATGAGAHAQAEPVHLVTAAVVRLVRTLAHEFLSMVCQGQPRRRIGSAGNLFASAGTAHPRTQRLRGHAAPVDTE